MDAATQIELIKQLPNIFAALAGLVAAILAVRNGWKTDRVRADVQAVAVNADAAATRADEVHAATQAIASKSDQIAAQTDGHLTRLTAELNKLEARNANLEKTVTTLVSIITATRVAEASAGGKEGITVPSVRTEDLATVVDTIAQIAKADDDPNEPRPKDGA